MAARRAEAAPAGGPSVAWRFATGLTEAAYLAALAIVPLYFNPRTERVFEPDKLAWALVLALVALWALTVRWLERPGRGVRRWDPITAAAALAMGALVVGAVLSVVPLVSWFGLYERGQGVLAYLGLALLFAAVAKTVRGQEAWERLALVVSLVAVPAALYAVLQRFGIDNVVWSAGAAEPQHRPFGSLGNPIFLGAYLMMVLPIALGEILRALAGDDGTVLRKRRIAGLGGALALSVAALVLSQSRGPVLGVLAALAMFGLLWAAAARRRRIVIALVGAGIGLAAVLLAVGTSGVQGVGRLGQLLSVGSRTARERILLWEALGDLAGADPIRAVTGYGPETTGFVVARHLSAELVRLAPDQVYDRAHNIVWEWWVSAGVVGAIAILLLHAAAFVTAYRLLGLVDDRRQGLALLAAMGVGAAIGLVGPILVPGATAFAAVGAALGLLAGAAAYAAVRGVRSTAGDEPRRIRGRRLITLSLAAVVAAHLVEGSLGLPTASSELLFWVSLGALAGLGMNHERGSSRGPPEGAPVGGGGAFADGLLSGLVLAAAVFAPILVATRSTPLGHPSVWLLLIVTWVCAELLRSSSDGPVWARPAARLAVLLGLAALLALLGGLAGGEIVAFAIVLLATTVAAGWAFSMRHSVAGTGETWRWIVYAGFALLVAVGGWRFVVTPVVADTRVRTGLRYVASGDLASAQHQFETAIAMWPTQPEYATYVSAVYHEHMRGAQEDRATADRYYEAASSVLADAYSRAPIQQHMLRLAMLHRDRGDREVNPSARLAIWEQSRGAFETALRQAPMSPETLAERAGLLERLGDASGSRQGYAAALDLGHPSAYWHAGLARGALAEGDVEAGQSAVARVIELTASDAEGAERVLGYPDGLPELLPGYVESLIVYMSLAGRGGEASELFQWWMTNDPPADRLSSEAREAIGSWLDRELAP